MDIRRRFVMLGAGLAALPLALIGPAAVAATGPAVVHPNSCQAPSASLTLETTSRGYTFDCTGYYFFPSGTYAYHLYSNGWSGQLSYYYNSRSVTLTFCNHSDIAFANVNVIDIYLSPTNLCAS
jgi:hypothetical protein